MSRPDSLSDFSIVEIMSKFAGIEAFPAKINGIGTGVNGREYISKEPAGANNSAMKILL